MMNKCSWNEAKQKITFDKGYVLAVFTDKVIISHFPLSQEKENDFNESYFDKILDCRIFNKDGEYRWFRADSGSKLHFRYLAGSDNCIDRYQFLDIDTTKSFPGGTIYATEGGRYELPVEKLDDAKLLIREYLQYDKSGNARVYDWRIVDFIEGAK